MDEEETQLVIAELTVRLVFDEEHGELVLIDASDDHAPTCIQAVGMLEMAKDAYLSGYMFEEADDE